MTQWGRTILHADMDAFYASVEQRDDPALRGKPVVVGGPSRRGVVAAASYEARVYGVHSAMPTAKALKRCPRLIVLPPRIEHYGEVSRQVFDIFYHYSPLVEPLSLDEAFLDISGTERLRGDPETVARSLKAEVRQQLELVVSVGVAPTKFVAKVASDLGKPDGLVLVREEQVRAFLAPLPVKRLFGAGRVTQRALGRLGIRTIGDLAAYPPDVLQARFGAHGEQLSRLARGDDPREVVPERPPKSLGHEDTFSHDKADPDELRQILLEQADRVARRLRRHALRARVVVLKVKTTDFKLHTRQRRLDQAVCDGDALGQTAGELLSELLPSVPGPFRLTGVTAAGLCPDAEPDQLTLDAPRRASQERLARTLDAISERFGDSSVRRASSLGRGRPSVQRKQQAPPGADEEPR